MKSQLPDGIVVREAEDEDVSRIAQINSDVFLGNRDNAEHADLWISAHFVAHPVYHYYVIEKDGVFAGYVGMQIHGGLLRASPVIEVEQVGIGRDFQGQGLATVLIKEAIRLSALLIEKIDNRIESHITFTVWAYEHNENALKVYEKIFTDGRMGERIQYGDRKEVMLRLRVPLVIPIRD